MEKTFEIYKNPITVAAVKFIYGEDAYVYNGILVHDENDYDRDFDEIYDGPIDRIKTADDLIKMLECEIGDMYFTPQPDGIYHIDEPNEE